MKQQIVFEQKSYAGVRQDKDTPRRIDKASGQPSCATTPAQMRPFRLMSTNSQRVENVITPHLGTNPIQIQTAEPIEIRPKHHGSDKRQLVEVAGCVPRHIAEQLDRMRDQGGKGKLSRSSVVASLLTKGVQTNVDMQYGATLQPVIENTSTTL